MILQKFAKLFRLLGILYKTKSFIPKRILKKLYYAFIHSLNFEFAYMRSYSKNKSTETIVNSE